MIAALSDQHVGFIFQSFLLTFTLALIVGFVILTGIDVNLHTVLVTITAAIKPVIIAANIVSLADGQGRENLAGKEAR
jgi:hypothetical protein